MPFGSSGAGTAGNVSVALLLCAGGSSGLNVGATATGGFFGGTPSDVGVPTDSDNHAIGAYAGGGFGGVFSPQATTVTDLKNNFRSEAINLGIGPLNGSVEVAHGTNERGETMEVMTVVPPFLSFGGGAAFTSMNTWTMSQTIWSQGGGWLSD